jgi:hypothetical protein
MRVFKDGKLSLEGFKMAKTLGMCVRCSLRFSGIEEMEIYRTKEVDLHDTLNQFLSTLVVEQREEKKEKQHFICSCCLGLSSDSFLNILQEQIDQKIKET